MNKFTDWLQATFAGTNLPTLTAMPAHVDAVRLDRGLLMLHFESAERPNTAVVTGYPTGNYTRAKKVRRK